MSEFCLWDGDEDERFVLTLGQLRDISARYALYGDRTFEGERYEDYARDDNDSLCDVCAREYQRMRRLHDVTAGHLMKARAELAELRDENAAMGEELDRWRGSVSGVAGNVPPAHYAGDGYVTCSRAMESAVCQDEVVPQSAMGMWWWMCAFKYVWRMWSKGDPAWDAHKAIDCLRRAVATLGEGGADE